MAFIVEFDDGPCVWFFESSQESAVCTFYDELFKSWSLRTGKSTSSLGDQEVVEVDDSGDEGSDLSTIMDVKVKDDPYEVDPCEAKQLETIASDLQDYTRSALEALGEAMQLDDSDDEPPVAPVHVPVVTPSVGETRADAVEMPSPKPPSKKEFQPLTMPQSVEEVEARIKYLECFDCTYGLRSNNHQV